MSAGSLDGRTLVPGCFISSLRRPSSHRPFAHPQRLWRLRLPDRERPHDWGQHDGEPHQRRFGLRCLLAGHGFGDHWDSLSLTFREPLIAGSSISVNTRAVWTGRALAGALAPSGAVTLLGNTITRPPALCSSLPTTGGTVLPGNTGVPLELRGQFPWLLLIGIGAGLGATAMGISSRRRRRRNA